MLKRKGWPDRHDDPLAEAEPALAQLWKAALLGRPIDDSEALQNKAQLRGHPAAWPELWANSAVFGPCAIAATLSPDDRSALGLRPTPLPRSGGGVETICVSPHSLCGRRVPR